VRWYQPEARLSHELIRRVATDRSSAILDVGGGASTLVDSLVADGYSNVTVLDIAANALAAARARLGAAAGEVRWMTGDVLDPEIADHTIDVWHDRAVFHFLTDAEDRQKYVDLVMRSLKPGGHIIVASFGPNGPRKCSGLDVVRYSPESMHGEFGSQFELINSFSETHNTPFGTTQELVYCYCRKVTRSKFASPRG